MNLAPLESFSCFFFNDTATTEIYTLSLHDALPIFYGSYTILERWRVNIFFALLAIGVVWLLWLKAPRRDLGAVYFFWVFPVVSYVLLTGGNESFSGRFWIGFIIFGALVVALFAFVAALLKASLRPALILDRKSVV